MDDPNDDYENQPRRSSQPFLDNNDNQTQRPSPWHKRGKRSKSSGRREPGNTTDAQGTLLNRLQFLRCSTESSLSGWRSYMLDPYTGRTIWLSPAKKDTILVPRKGHVVLRFLADNPGIWMFHSSVIFHMATGTAMGILVGGNEQHTVVDDRAEDSCPFDRPH